MLSAKNSMISASASDLGLGDQLQSQTESEVNARKKKLQKPGGIGFEGLDPTNAGVGPATMALFQMKGLG